MTLNRNEFKKKKSKKKVNLSRIWENRTLSWSTKEDKLIIDFASITNDIFVLSICLSNPEFIITVTARPWQ